MAEHARRGRDGTMGLYKLLTRDPTRPKLLTRGDSSGSISASRDEEGGSWVQTP